MKLQTLDVTLSSYVFDRSHPAMKRDKLGIAEDRSETYDERYDFYTLVYDCYFDQGSNQVVLICPTLMNFQPLVEAARWFIDGVETSIESISALSRGSVVSFDAPTDAPVEITAVHSLFSFKLHISPSYNDLFAGKNAVYAISKDNKLEWIRDWLKFYVSEHGANAFVIYDNHSTSYSMDELKETLGSVAGVETVALVRAWFPFGPGGAKNTNFNSKFLHMTMVELGRRRLLRSARAVLNVDIDELVYSHSGQSIFDATAESEQGYVRFNGRWAFANPPADGRLVRHADHTFIRSDGRPKVNRKYCVAPQGELKDRAWLTHRIISRRDPTDPDFGFWHFRRISGNWDYDREDFDAELLENDPLLVETMGRAFPSNGPITSQQSEAEVTVPEVAAPVVEKNTAENALIITSMKNEGPYILEWIAYHRLIGFKNFLVYTNDCTDGTDEILDRMDELGILTHVRNEVLRRGPQKSALKWAFGHQLALDADWILVSDADEFLNIKVGEGKLNDLLAAVPNADAIPVTWKLFSNDQRVEFSENLVIADYTDAEKTIADGGQSQRFAKTIFRRKPEITRFGTHGPIHEDEAFGNQVRWVAPDGGTVMRSTCTRPETAFAYDVAQFNHYATRAVDSFLVKRDRGRVNHFRQDMKLDYWIKMNQGGERDETISHWIEPTKAEIDRILADKTLAELVSKSIAWHRNRISELRADPDFGDMRTKILEM